LEPRYLKSFSLLRENKELLEAAHAATPSALAALERVYAVDPRIREALARHNYSYLESIGFNFQKLNGARVLILEGDVLYLRRNKIVYEETAAHFALLRFSEQWHTSLEAKYRELWRLWNTAPVGYHTLDREGRITAVNETEAKMLGYSPEEMRARSIFEFIHPDQREIARRRFLQKLNGDDVPPVQDRIYLCKDGKEVNMSASDSVNFGDSGQVIGVKTVLVDISKLRKLQEQLYQLQKLDDLRGLAGGFAHEFNNIMHAVLAATRLIIKSLKTGQSPEAQKDPQMADILTLLEVIEESSVKATHMTADILAYARLKNFTATSVDPKRVLEEVAKIARQSSEEAIKYELDLSNSWQIEGGEHQVFQCVLNLCLNARDAGAKTITINLKDISFPELYRTRTGQILKPGKYVAVSVRDNGEGIPFLLQSKIFDLFFTTKEPTKGTGLGLSTVLGIVDAHGGGIDFSSEPGRGTEFKLYFPAVELS
jgi:PAS domain S-box-containing protein